MDRSSVLEEEEEEGRKRKGLSTSQLEALSRVLVASLARLHRCWKRFRPVMLMVSGLS